MSRHQRYYDGLNQLTTEQGLSTRVANDVLYFRQQANWSQELENQFIAEAQGGVVPDITQLGSTA